MDFHMLAHAVQHSDISWFLKEQPSSKYLNVTHKKTGDTVLHLASRFGRHDLLEHIILQNQNENQNGSEILQVSNYEGKKPLHEAAQFGQLKCADILLRNGVQVDCLKRSDWTPLMLACTKTELSMISLLLKHGADPALVNKDGWNSFHIAAREGNVEILHKLLEANCDLWKAVSYNGRTPLHTAALHGRDEAVVFLLTQCDYTADMGDNCGVTPLMDALRAGFVDNARLLITRQKADVQKRDILGRQALHHAVQSGQTISIEFLLAACGIHVDTTAPPTNITALHVAAKEGQDEMVKLLLQKGADVNVVDHKGRTALHIASGAQHASCVKLLLENGAVDKTDVEGQLAKQLAKHKAVKEAFEIHSC